MKQNEWDSVAGKYLTAWEQKLLDTWAADAFGFYAAQLGHTARLHGLAQNRCSQRWAIEVGERLYESAHAHEVRHVDVGDFTVLPFESDSLDVLILPHTLDDHPEPHAVLREAYRVLRPEGKMIILGCNPISLWGASARFARWRGQSWWAYRHQSLHVGRLKDWLQLLNCDITQGKYGCYAPYVRSDQWLRRWRWMENAGDRWWGMAGAVYAIMAVKRVHAPTLVGLINEKKNNRSWIKQPALNTVNHHKTEHQIKQ